MYPNRIDRSFKKKKKKKVEGWNIFKKNKKWKKRNLQETLKKDTTSQCTLIVMKNSLFFCLFVCFVFCLCLFACLFLFCFCFVLFLFDTHTTRKRHCLTDKTHWLQLRNRSFLPFLYLTLMWSRGVHMDPKFSFCSSAQKRKKKKKKKNRRCSM